MTAEDGTKPKRRRLTPEEREQRAQEKAARADATRADARGAKRTAREAARTAARTTRSVPRVERGPQFDRDSSAGAWVLGIFLAMGVVAAIVGMVIASSQPSPPRTYSAPSYSTPPYSTPSHSEGSSGDSVQVRGYYRKDGTYVQPHTRRSPR